MAIETGQRGGYLVYSVQDNLGANSDISELESMVESKLEEGPARIALAFTPGSFLSSRVIATLVRCFALVEEAEGEMAVVLPSAQLEECIDILGFRNLVRMVKSVDELEVGAKAGS